MGKEDIEKPWCIYGWYLGPWGFGKIERDFGTTVDIRYSEGQMYHPTCWGSDWVKRFDTLDEAVEYYIENRPETDIRDRGETNNEIRERARVSFPSYYKKILPMVISN